MNKMLIDCSYKECFKLDSIRSTLVYTYFKAVAITCGKVLFLISLNCKLLKTPQTERILDLESLSSVIWLLFHKAGYQLKGFAFTWVYAPFS